MNRISVLVFVVIFTFSCASPDKEQGSAADTLALDTVMTTMDTAQVKAPIDTVTADTVMTTRAFDKTDSSTYYELVNYFKDLEVAVKPAEIQTVDSTCAILIYPTEEQLAELKTEYGDNFQTVASDNIYYHGMAIQMLDSINVETVTANARYINFKGRTGTQAWTLDIRKEGAPPWNLIFFHRNKKPEIVPFVDLSKQKIVDYFQIQETSD